MFSKEFKPSFLLSKMRETIPIISQPRSIIVACDVPYQDFSLILKGTKDNDKVGGYKIPARAVRKGLETWVRTAREIAPEKKLIYDHQKAGKDISSVADGFMKDVSESGIDAVIIYPEIKTEIDYVEAALKYNLNVMVGGKMTNQEIGAKEDYEKAFDIYRIALKLGINNLCIPASNKKDRDFVTDLIETLKLKERKYITYYPIGIGHQGGSIGEISKILVDSNFHPIVGRTIYNSPDKQRAALDLTNQL